MKLDEIGVGDSLPELAFEPNEVDLFFFNAALWNGHRIHYDAPYTRDEEGYPAVVIDGPLQGDWLAQVVTEWVQQCGEITALEYSHRRAAFVGERLHAGGRVEAVDRDAGEVRIRLAVTNETGEVITPGRATVRLTR